MRVSDWIKFILSQRNGKKVGSDVWIVYVWAHCNFFYRISKKGLDGGMLKFDTL